MFSFKKRCFFSNLLFSSRSDDSKKFKKSPGRFKSKKRCVLFLACFNCALGGSLGKRVAYGGMPVALLSSLA